MDVPLTAKEAEYVAEMVRSGRAASEGEVLREALQLLMDRDAEDGRKYEAWRDETRRTIEVRYQRALEGGFVDGEAAFERVRQRMEERLRPRP